MDLRVYGCRCLGFRVGFGRLLHAVGMWRGFLNKIGSTPSSFSA